MARLYDRVLSEECDALTAQQVYDVGMTLGEADGAHRRMVADALGRTPTEDELAARVSFVRQQLRDARSEDVLLPDELEDAVVVSAEEVADYTATFEAGTNLVPLLDRLTPPFDRTFVEFQARKNIFDLSAWGVLFTSERLAADDPSAREWRLDAALVAEWAKGRPVGPLVRWKLFLDPQGRARPVRDEVWTLPEGVAREGRSDLGTFLMVPIAIPNVPDATAYSFGNSCTDLLAPALFTLSLIHCKNVDVHVVEPPERLSRKHQRKTGRPLTRYYVLDIQPMRRVLETEGQARTKGLDHALHICRGHFKTFSDEAPLFGKHTGTYWWESQVRGKVEAGVVEKDYRLRIDDGLGRDYVDADEHLEIAPSSPEHTGIDPDLGGRGLRAHNATQNELARVVRVAGYEPRRPRPDEPQYDLAWIARETTWVAEVKSITPENEERQLRTALGQVLRYRQLLEEALAGGSVRAMIVTEREPSDSSWSDLCAREDVILAWPPELSVR